MPRRRRHKAILQQAPIVATIGTMSHDGRGITHVNGKTVFVNGALPGETVQFQTVRQRNQFDEAQAIQVLSESPQRCQPRCPHFGTCGGCSLQHLDLTAQLQHKQRSLQELLWRQAKLQPQQWLPPISSPAWGYRRKARLGVKFIEKKQQVVVGFRERQGRLITQSQQCEVLASSIGQKITALTQMIADLSIRHKVPQLEIAVGDNASAVIIRHLAALSSSDLTTLEHFSQQHQLRLYLQPSGTDSVQLFYPATAEELYYLLPRYSLKLEFHPSQFIQINASVNQAMIDLALELLDCQPQDRILDLFCGIGNFSLPLAKRGAQVIGVEGDAAAVRQAQHNARLNQLVECQFYCADLFQPSFTAEWARRPVDKLLLDPPRSGAESIIGSIQQWRPQRIVYVSCDLATLARDSLSLSQQGYLLAKAGIMDMFPHTQHAEAIALFILE